MEARRNYKTVQQLVYEKLVGYISEDDKNLILLSLFEKWNPIALGCHIDDGINDCPLCKKYWHDGCNKCPICKKTGETNCRNTPYVYYASLLAPGYIQRYKAVEEEMEFLISLLDEETQKNLESIFIEWCKNGGKLWNH